MYIPTLVNFNMYLNRIRKFASYLLLLVTGALGVLQHCEDV